MMPSDTWKTTQHFVRTTIAVSLALATTAAGALPAAASSRSYQSTTVVPYSPSHPYPNYPPFTGHANITWWTWTANPQKVVAIFEKQYPNIHVTIANPGAGTLTFSKLLTALRAGSGAPCVSQMQYPTLPEFVATGKVLNIAPYVNQYRSYFAPAAWNLVKFGSAVYGVPEDWGTNGYAYRPAVFHKYGLVVPKTWSQFAADAVKLHKENPKMYLAEFPEDSSYVWDILWQAGLNPFEHLGGTHWAVALNTPAAQRVMQFWGNLIKEGAILPAAQYTAPDDARMAAGVYASYVLPVWGPTYLLIPAIKPGTQHFTLTSLPNWNATRPLDSSDVASLNLVTDQCPYPQAAALFAVFINTDRAELQVAALPGTAKGGGRGLFESANARATVPAFNARVPLFGTQNVNQVFGALTKQITTPFTYSPWEGYLDTELGAQLTSAAEGHEPFSAVLANTQKGLVQFARSEGYSITVKS